ncbi:STAS domain-containing protein [Streptacidiphilus sp. N1-12]|uniref:Anti-sigma factor antagonist n=2 Tax=Streptacidiphilus alkalitolerans TaxID=3342712 RepID=A0ABV6WSS5_9ACTN
MTDLPLLDIVVVDIDRTARVLLSGELDLSTGPRMRGAVAEILEDPLIERIVIDAGLLTFCDSTGLGILMAVHRLASEHGVALYLSEVSPRLQRLLRETGFSRRLSPPP